MNLFGRAAAVGLVALLASASFAGAADDAPPVGYVPDMKSSEAGLWMMSEKAEKAVQTSPLLVRDPALNAYLRGIVCKLVDTTLCPALRIYIVEDPTMNAGTLPNGAVVVHTGLLLRMQNEAQLAFVLGHEITHYTKRHTLKRFESARDTMNSVAFLGLAGLAALPIELLAIEGIMSYTRDQEREADQGGFERAVAAGYDPVQAGAIWRMMSVEDKADPHRSGPGLFGRDHPTDEERLKTLAKRGTELEASRTDWIAGVDVYRARVTPFRDQWLTDELARGKAWESVVVLERMVADEPSSGTLRYYLGEAYRKRGKDNDDVKLASDAYTQAIACADAPPQAWRDLGLMAMKGGDKQTAKTDFDNYLAHAPKADDRAMIEFYETQLGPK